MDRLRPTRRQLLAATGGLGAAAVAGCGSAGEDGGEDGGQDGGQAGTGEPGGGALVALDEVPVGGAVGVQGPDGPLIVARPAQDEAVAFSAICTHQGCTVAPDGERLRCPCHGSVFDALTGENLEGPAPEPLPPVDVSVADGQVRAG